MIIARIEPEIVPGIAHQPEKGEEVGIENPAAAPYRCKFFTLIEWKNSFRGEQGIFPDKKELGSVVRRNRLFNVFNDMRIDLFRGPHQVFLRSFLRSAGSKNK